MLLQRVLHSRRPSEARAAVSTPEGVFGRHNLLVAGALFLFALSLMAVTARYCGIAIRSVSPAPHFVYQAWSWLHGRWDIDLAPVSYGVGANDVIVLHGKHYIVVPPFPAVLLLPLVAIWGLHTSDILFTMVVSACNLSLIYLLFEQLRANGLSHRSWREHVVIGLFFSFGTISLWLSLDGRMWFTAQIVGLGCVLLALLLAFRRHFVWSAVALGCAFFCRSTLALGFPFLFYLAWQDAGSGQMFSQFVRSLRARRLAWTAVPWRRFGAIGTVGLATVGLYLARNYALFGNPLESGYNILDTQLYPYLPHGLFSIRYVPSNFIANFLSFPHVIYSWGFDHQPNIDMLNGGYAVSVFATTPLFLFLFSRNRQRSLLRVALWATIGVTVAAALLYNSTGWFQFGARYLLDTYPFAFVLLTVSEARMDWRFMALGSIGILVNFLGAYQYWFDVLHYLGSTPLHL